MPAARTQWAQLEEASCSYAQELRPPQVLPVPRRSPLLAAAAFGRRCSDTGVKLPDPYWRQCAPTSYKSPQEAINVFVSPVCAYNVPRRIRLHGSVSTTSDAAGEPGSS